MSRLDSAIRRLKAQRSCLDAAVVLIETDSVAGPVMELGLGNGRTYDHIREALPGREIFVFERKVAAHPDCIPDQEHLFLGDVFETLPLALARFEGKAALIHADIGSGDEAANAQLAAGLAPYLGRLLAPGGILVSDQNIPIAGAIDLALPESVRPGRYHMRRVPLL